MILFSTVTKSFGGDTSPALENISFEVQKGEFIFLTGPSGSGKSTLLKIITREYLPTSGDVQFESESLNKLRGSKIHHHRRKIGVVFQDYRLLPELNVWENVALPLQIIGKSNQEIEERVTDLLTLVQLTDKAYSFPGQLSGGESQRIGIARALATAPSVLLADEPTGNLDPINTQLIARLFHKIHEMGTTILFATHDPTILSAFPYRRIHLEKGRLVEDVKAADHLAHPSSKPATISPARNKGEKKAQHSSEVTEVHSPIKEVTEAKKPAVPSSKPKMGFPKIKLQMPFGKKKAAHSEPPTEIEKQMSDMLVKIENLDEKETK
jgi:cell division transport system ATP-binding protein